MQPPEVAAVETRRGDAGPGRPVSEPRVIVLTGVTGSGKSALALALARELGGEILSIDSMQVYRRMDIGTAKPTPAEQAQIPHHLIDVAEPWEAFSAARFVEQADAAVAGIHGRGKPVIAVGGTVLYLKCFYEGLFEGPSADEAIRTRLRARAEAEGIAALHGDLARVDPRAAERIHPNDLRRIERALEVFELSGRPISELQREWEAPGLRRPEWQWTLLALRREKEVESRRINERVRGMIAGGLEAEARALWEDPRGLSTTARQALGYAEWFACFGGELAREKVVERIKINSRQLAKHQRTWLRRFESLQWIDVLPTDAHENLLRRALAAIVPPTPAAEL